jgi:hypothetical protein
MITTPGTYQEPDISTDDVDSYTNSQIPSSADETQNMLTAALAAARQDCRWHVAPVTYGETITLDGTGTPYLRLPTSGRWDNTITVHSITSDGAAVDPVNGVTRSAETPNLLILNNGVWSNNYSGVTITWDHGFGLANGAALDWRQAILALVVNIAQIYITGRPDYELESKGVDDVVYRWGAVTSLGSIEPILAKYRLLFRWV